MVEGIGIMRTRFFKEKYHEEKGKEVYKDGDKWYFTASGFVLATITYQKFIKFVSFNLSYLLIGSDNKVREIPKDQKDHETLNDATTMLMLQLERMDKVDKITGL